MLESLATFLSSNGFIPHGHCYLWKPELVWLHVVSDALVALAYYSIPVLLLYLVRKRRDLPFNWMFLLFGCFIVACGTSHVLEIWTLWHPFYWLSGTVKLFTAIVSLYTAGELFNLVPQALALPSPAQLKATNCELQEQIVQRQEVERERHTLSLALENAVEGIAQLDMQGRYITVNAAYARIVGYAPEEMIGLNWQSTVHSGDLKILADAYLQMLENGKVEVEARGIRKDGSVFYKRVVMVTTYDEQQTMTGHYCFMKDVTERKRMEETLQTEREFLNAVLENIEDGIVACDAQGNLVLFNRAGQSFHGLPETPLPPERWAYHYDLYFPDGETRMTGAEVPLIRALRGEVVRNVEMVIAPQQGSPRSIQASGQALFDANGTKLGAVVSMHDITLSKRLEAERQQAEKAQQRYTARLQQGLAFEALLKRITDKVRDSLEEDQILQTAVDELGQGLGVRCCYATLYNLQCSTATLRYEYTTSLLSQQGRELPMAETPDLYKQLQQGEYFQFCEMEFDPIQGRVMTLACPILDNQEVLGDLRLVNDREYTFKDLELRLVQQVANQCAIALRQARFYQAAQAQVAELERLNQLKDDFLSTVSHELRTPIANIKMAAQMLKLTPMPERSQRYLEILQAECTREANLINDLLDLQRLEASSDVLTLTDTILLQDWLPHFITPFIARAQEQDQTVQLTLPPDLPSLVTHESSLERIVSELLNNACKYTPAGGRIQFDLHLLTSEDLTRTSKTIVFEICNQAEIPAAELPHIFDKFYRVPETDRWKRGGTGLGLALVKKLVDRLQGVIGVKSTDGWTTFTVQLPIYTVVEKF